MKFTNMKSTNAITRAGINDGAPASTKAGTVARIIVCTFASVTTALAVGCSSPDLTQDSKPRSDSADRGVPQDNTSAPYASGSVNLASPTTKEDLETSDVIAKKSNTDVKCPKKARVVNGKCVLKVEETDVTE